MANQVQDGPVEIPLEQQNGDDPGLDNSGPDQVTDSDTAELHKDANNLGNDSATASRANISEKVMETSASGVQTGVVQEQDGSLERIISECNSAAQQMKQTIHEVLRARLEMGDPTNQEESPEEDLIKRLVLLRQVIQKNVGEEALPLVKSGSSDDVPASLAVADTVGQEMSPKGSTPPLSRMAASVTSLEKACEETAVSPMEQNASVTHVSEPRMEEAVAKAAVQTKAAATAPCERRESPLRKMPAKHSSSSSKRKGEKTVESIMRGLASYPTADAKLEALCERHLSLLDATRVLQLRVQQADRTAAQVLREKEQLQGECNRALLARSRLEGLCRELQRQSRAIKEESALRIREEEEKRKEVAGKFQVALQDITALLQDNQARSLQLRKENTELVQKLKTLVDHYEIWEKHMGTMLEQKELQAQMARAKQVRTEAQLHQERQAFLQEKQQILQRVSDTQRHTEQLAANEAQLRAELALYTSKYQEFQGALSQSNQVFRTFKADMEQMSKKIKKLEKETVQWKTRWESSNKALAEMAADKEKRDQELLSAQQRVITLEKLCRALQLERNELNKKLQGTTTAIQGTNAVDTEAS